MAEFKYITKNQSGKVISGKKIASSKESLMTELTRKNLIVVSIEETEKKPGEELFAKVPSGGERVKMVDLIAFCRQLAAMLRGGVPILRAIESITFEMKDRHFKGILHNVMQDLRSGKTLSEAFQKYPHTFSLLFNAIMETGEKVGSLDEMLSRLSNYLESRHRLITKMRSATTYPLFLFIFFLVAIAVVTLFLIPRFQSMYDGFGVKLPALTLFIFNTSSFIIKKIYIVLPALIAIIASLIFYIKNTKRGKTGLDRTLLSLPIFGDVIKKGAVSKFCRTLSTLLNRGISPTEALPIVGKTSGNIIIENACNQASKFVLEGDTIPFALNKVGVFPSLMLQMVSVGVESGSLPELLDKTADFYEEQVDNFINTMSSMVEPILIVCLGAGLAVVIVALYLPIFRLTTAIIK